MMKSVVILIIFYIFCAAVNKVEGQELETMHDTGYKLLMSFKEHLKELTDYISVAQTNSLKEREKFPSSCLTSTFNASGVYRIQVPGVSPFPVYCDNDAAGPGWLVIQRRFNGSLSFFRNWQEYKEGFGDLNGEFFIGLEKLRAITALEPFELYIKLEDFDGETRHAKFDEFAIGKEQDSYPLIVLGTYSGTAGDSLRSHYKMKFSTYDRDNDKKFGTNCAFLHVGAWWYNECVDSNLNGQYIAGGHYEEKLFARGMCWRAWRGHNYGYKLTQMMIRPKCQTASEATQSRSPLKCNLFSDL